MITEICDGSWLSTYDVEQQPRRALDRLNLQSRIDTPFTSMRGIRVQTITARLTQNNFWAKKRALEEDVLRFVTDCAAHDRQSPVSRNLV